MLRSNPGFFQASLTDPWEATHETILYMCGLVRASQSDPVIAEAAADAVKRFAFWCGGNRRSPGVLAECCWWWAKHAIKFVHHQALLRAWMGKSDELQLLISPDELLKMAAPKGDCAVFTCLICAMLDQLGVPWEIVTVAVDPNQPDVFSHVYPRAVLQPGYCLPLDASHGKYPGWEVPGRRVSMKQVWNSAGEPIEDQDSGFRGLHGMLGGGPLNGVGLNGLGQDDGTDEPIVTLSDEPVVAYTTSVPAVTDTIYSSYQSDANGNPLPAASSTPAASNTALANVLSNFASAWTKIAGNVIAPQVTETGPGGTSITGPASALQSILGSGTVNLGGTSTSITTLLLLAGGAILVISMLGKGK